MARTVVTRTVVPRTLVVRPADDAEPVDLAARADLSQVREVVVLPGARVRDLTALAGAPELRELVLSDSAASAADLSVLLTLPRLERLHLNGLHVPDGALAPLAGAPRLKRLVLHRVTGPSGAGLAGLEGLTQLSLSETELTGPHDLGRAPRLRRLQVSGVELPELGLLRARSLADVDIDVPAADEDGLAGLLADRRRLRTFDYPLRDPALLAGCTALEGLTLHGGTPAPDLAALAHLPVRAVRVLCAPSRERAEDLLAQAALVWPGLVQTGWREDW